VLELPALEQFASQVHEDGVQVVLISVKGIPADVRRLTSTYRLPVLLDRTGEVAKRYQVVGQPYTVVIKESLVSARFLQSMRQVGLLDALRLATGTSGPLVLAEAGRDWRRKQTEFVQENGELFEQGRFRARLNDGRWTSRPDGTYLDPTTHRVFAIATVKGRPTEALVLAEVHARNRLFLQAEPLCTSGGETGAAARAAAVEPEYLAARPRCSYSGEEVYASIDASLGTVRVALFWQAAGELFRRTEAETVTYEDGMWRHRVRPAPPGANLMPMLRQKLAAAGRLVPQALEPEKH